MQPTVWLEVFTALANTLLMSLRGDVVTSRWWRAQSRVPIQDLHCVGAHRDNIWAQFKSRWGLDIITLQDEVVYGEVEYVTGDDGGEGSVRRRLRFSSLDNVFRPGNGEVYLQHALRSALICDLERNAVYLLAQSPPLRRP